MHRFIQHFRELKHKIISGIQLINYHPVYHGIYYIIYVIEFLCQRMDIFPVKRGYKCLVQVVDDMYM